jgi:hypothetical protein
MPLVQIYTCVICEAATRIPHGAPVPEHCAHPMRWRQTREHKPEHHGWSTGVRAPAVGFRHTNPWVIPVEGKDGQQLEVTSLREIRRLENESEKMAADGVGQAMRFRAFNNDLGNSNRGAGLYENSFGAPPQRKPQLFDKQGRQRISLTPVAGDQAEHDADQLGPGTDPSAVSALPESP